MEEPDETEAIKVPLSVVWHAIQLLPALNILVHKANYVTTHAYTLAAWIFINEIHDDDTFDPEPFITYNFFKEVWLALTTRKRYKKVQDDTRDARALIDMYLEPYLVTADIKPVAFRNPNQVANYEAKRMLTAYTNHVKMRFGDYLRYAINLLLNTKGRAAAIQREMADASKTAIRQACNAGIWQPARRAKEAIARRNPDLAALDRDTAARLAPLYDVLEAYPLGYTFDRDDRFIDAIKYPASHVKALFELALVLEKVKAKKHIQCFPLRTSWVPCHVHVDTQVLCPEVLDVAYKRGVPYQDYWRQVLDIDGGVCQERRGKLFWGAVQTDGVSVSVVKKTLGAKNKTRKRGKANPDKRKYQPTKRPREEKAKPAPKRQKVWKKGGSGDQDGHGGSGGPGGSGPGQPARVRVIRPRRRRGKRRNRDVGRVPYITELTRPELRATAGRCVFIDPGRRDLLYAVHEYSDVALPMVYRYTRNQQAKERRTTHLLRIREQAKREFDELYGDEEWSVRAAEKELAKHQCWSLDPTKFRSYVEARASVWGVLSTHYGYWTTAGTASSDLLSLEYKPPTLRKPVRKPKTVAASSQPAAAESAGPQATTTPLPTTKHGKGGVVGQRVARAQPLHRKLRLLAYIHTERANARLVRSLRVEFGDNAVLIMGDWSAPHQRFHEPIRGKGMRKMLRRHGLTVHLVDEYMTSSLCPACGKESLHKFKEVDNPRPWMRQKMPKVICHGLLECRNPLCPAQKDKHGNPLPDWRCWNRDMVGALNFAHILRSVRAIGEVPERFRRAQPAQD